MQKWLTELRENRKLTKKAFAEILGIDETTLGKYENGKRRPSVDKAQAIAEILEIDWRLFFPRQKTL